MSLNGIAPLMPIACYDPKINFTDKNLDDKFLVYKGPSAAQIYTLAPQTGDTVTDGGESSFQLYLPSRSTALDKTIVLNATLTVDLTSSTLSTDTTTNSLLLRSDRFGLQAFPLNHMISNIIIDIDGSTWSANVGEFYPTIKYFQYSEEDLQMWNSTSPSLLDNKTMFSQSTVSNVLAGSNNESYNQIPSRGSFPIKSYYEKTPFFAGTPAVGQTQVARLVYELHEPLQLSPLVVSNSARAQNSQPSFIGISNIKIKILWYSAATAFNRVFKIAPFASPSMNPTIGSVPTDPSPSTYTYNNAAYTPPAMIVGSGKVSLTGVSLTIATYSLPSTMVPPQVNVYEWTNIQYLKQVANIKACGGTTTNTGLTPSINEITGNNVQLSSVPHSVIIAVVANTQTLTMPGSNYLLRPFERGDFFLPINKIRNLTFSNRSGLLTQMSPWSLYKCSVSNGLKFVTYGNSGMSGQLIPEGAVECIAGSNPKMTVREPLGCPLALKFGSSNGIPIDDPTLGSGVAVNLNLQINFDCLNYYPFDITGAEVYFIFFYEGAFTISSSAGNSFSVGFLTRDDVLSSDENGIEDMEDLAPTGQNTMVGGSFMGKLKSFGRKTSKFLTDPKVLSTLRTVLGTVGQAGVPGASAIGDIVELGSDFVANRHRGNGMQASGSYVAGRLAAGSQVGGRLAAGSAVGGASMTAAQLRSRLRQ